MKMEGRGGSREDSQLNSLLPPGGYSLYLDDKDDRRIF